MPSDNLAIGTQLPALPKNNPSTNEIEYVPTLIRTLVDLSNGLSETNNWSYLFAYLLDLWVHVCGGDPQNLDGPYAPQYGPFQINFIGNVTAVALNAVPVPGASDQVYGAPGIYQLGYFAFMYGGVMDRLQWINFSNQLFLPSYPLPTGFAVWPKPNVPVSYTLFRGAKGPAMYGTNGPTDVVAPRNGQLPHTFP